MAREANEAGAERVPPGQGVTKGWPTLHVGEVPAFDPVTGTLRVHGSVNKPREFDREKFSRLPRVEAAAARLALQNRFGAERSEPMRL